MLKVSKRIQQSIKKENIRGIRFPVCKSYLYDIRMNRNLYLKTITYYSRVAYS